MEFLHGELLDVDSIHNTARGFVRAVQDGGGATAHLSVENYLSTDGYMVGGAVPEIKIPVEKFDGRVAFHGVCDLAKALESSAKQADALGVWVMDGTAYMDASNVVYDREAALALGRSRGEVSIYERETGRVIYCATGTTEPTYT